MTRLTRTRNIGSGDTLAWYLEGSKGVINNSFTSPIMLKKEIDKPIVRPRYRLCWLNEDETVRKPLPEKDILSGGSYSENYQDGQRRTLSISLFNEHGRYTPSINSIWEGTKFSFEMGMELENGTVLWFPKGVFVVTSASVGHGVGDKTVSVELSDKFATLEGSQGTLETTYTIPPDMEIEEIIRDILYMPKGNGSMIDTQPIIYDSSFKGKKTQATITQQAGSTYGSIILALAKMLSAEVFYDVEGHLNFVPINTVTNDIDKPIIYHLYEEKGDFGSNNLSFDFASVINRVIIIGATVNQGVCRAVAVNDDASSPLSYQRIGYRTASPINDSAITSDVLAQERADYELRQKLILKTSTSQETRYNPLLMVNNLISVTDEFFGFKQEKFLIQSISCPLDYSGTMSVTAANARNLPFLVA